MTDRRFGSALIAQLPSLRRYATGLCGNATAADDLVQDCIERALRRADSLEDPTRLAPWLRAILYNLFMDDRRRHRLRGASVDMQDVENDLALSTPAQDRSEVQDIVRASLALTVEHRQILLLVGVEGLSYREVAEELGVPMGTVMSRLARARERLREALSAPPAASPAVTARPVVTRVLNWGSRA